MSRSKSKNPTRDGVYHDLKQSIYTASRGEVVFFFSSNYYRNKFFEQLEEQRKEFDSHLNKKVDEHFLNLNWLADIHLYKRVEKRGFYVKIGCEEVAWLELCRYASWNVMWQNTEDYEEMQKRS